MTGEEGGIGIDIIRCHFNNFVETDHELPIFAPTDESPPCTGRWGTTTGWTWASWGRIKARRL